MAAFSSSMFSQLPTDFLVPASPVRPNTITNNTDIYQIDKFIKECIDSGLEIYKESDFERVKLLGAGHTMSVYEAKWISKSKWVALKYINLTPPTGASSARTRDSELQDILRAAALELRVLRHEHSRRHPNIVDILAVSWQHIYTALGSYDIYPVLVMELACLRHPTLDQLLCMQVTMDVKLSLLRDVLEGISVVHKLLVIHGDIKPANVLIFEAFDGRLTAKISDFGFSQSDSHPRWADSIAGGTEYWNAPECLASAPESLRPFEKSKQRDVYSYGLLACFVLLEELPFQERNWTAEKLSEMKLGNEIGKMMLSRWRFTKPGDEENVYDAVDLDEAEVDTLHESNLVWEVRKRSGWCKCEEMPLPLLKKIPDMLQTDPLKRTSLDCIRSILNPLSDVKYNTDKMKEQGRGVGSAPTFLPRITHVVGATRNMAQKRPYDPSIPRLLQVALFKKYLTAARDDNKLKRIEAMVNIGNAMMTPFLARKDIPEAMFWFSRAAKEGSQEGQEMVFRLERQTKCSVVELIPGVDHKVRAEWMLDCLLRDFRDDVRKGPISTDLDLDRLQGQLRKIMLEFNAEMIENGLQRAIDNDVVRRRPMKTHNYKEDKAWEKSLELLIAIERDDAQALNEVLSSDKAPMSSDVKMLLVLAASEERSEAVLRALVYEHHFELDGSFTEALLSAFYRSDDAIATLLIDMGTSWMFILAPEVLNHVLRGCNNSTVQYVMQLSYAFRADFPECPESVDQLVRHRATMDGIRHSMSVHPTGDSDTVDNLQPPLFTAILYDRVYSVRVILALGANPNIRYMGITALHLAARLLRPLMVAILLMYGADPNARDFRFAYQTPLHQASLNKIFVKYTGPDAYTGGYRNIFGEPFSPASQGLDEDNDHRRLIIRLLLAYGADLDALDRDQATPLIKALESTPLHAPVIARCLIDLGSDISRSGVRGFTAVHAASASAHPGALHILRHLLYEADGALLNKPSKDGLTPLHLAAQAGRLESLTVLLEAGADVSIREGKGYTAFDLTMMSSNKEVFDILLHHISVLPARARYAVVSPNENKWTAAHSALCSQDRTLIPYFLIEVIPLMRDVDGGGTTGFTPLHCAVSKRHGPAMEYLIRKGANINFKGLKGLTPLHVAYGFGDETLIKFLHSQKADATIRDEYGLTPLEYGNQAGQNREKLDYMFNEGLLLMTNVTEWEKISRSLKAEVEQEKKRLEEGQCPIEDGDPLESFNGITMVETAHIQAVEASISKRGERSLQTLKRMNNLGCVYERYGRLGKAQQMYWRGWKLSREIAGARHRLTQDYANKIARVRSDLGQSDDTEIRQWISDFGETTLEAPLLPFLYVPETEPAKPHHFYRRQLPQDGLRSLEERRTTLDKERLRLSREAHELGVCYLRSDKLDEAEIMYLRALEGFDKALDLGDRTALNTVNQLGLIYLKQGRLADAEGMYLRAMEGFEKHSEPDHPTALNSVSQLGYIYLRQGKLDDAESMYQKAVKGYEKTLDSGDMVYLATISSLGSAYHKRGKVDDAERTYQRAVAGYEKALSSHDALVKNTIKKQDSLDDSQKKPDTEENIRLRITKIYESVIDEINVSISDIATSLGSLYLSQGKLANAENMYVRGLQGYAKVPFPSVELSSIAHKLHDMRVLLLKRTSSNQSVPKLEGGVIDDNRFKILKGLIELTRKGGDTIPMMYGTLGRALMWVASDEPNAKIAFARQMELLQKESSLHANNNANDIQCARCHAMSTSCSMKKWFICKDCTDIDLCGDCVEGFERKKTEQHLLLSPAACLELEHSLLDISDELSLSSSFGEEKDLVADVEREREIWLQNLGMAYPESARSGNGNQGGGHLESQSSN